jgi:Domain of unknown function (DUF4190)
MRVPFGAKIPVVGVVLGVMARKQLDVSGESGRGLARAAVIIGILGTLFQLAFFIVWLSLFATAVTQSGVAG